jgi:hypothetical protein
MLKKTQETVDVSGHPRSNEVLAATIARRGEAVMLRPLVLVSLASLLALGATPAQAQSGAYRGMPAGWPAYSNGYYAAYQPYGAAQPYTTARPVIPVVPVTAAYANPAYFGAYSGGYRGVQPAGYGAPVNVTQYAPQAVQYAPQYAPQQSYAVAPGGSAYAGSEAATFYGQPAAVNYVPPRFSYRPAYAQVPVYAYRPVTTYYAGSMQSTCQQPLPPATTCQPTTTSCGGSWCSWLNPFNHRWFKHNWFGHGGGCGSAPTTAYCGQYAAPTTAYCGQAACGQTYVPTVAACGATSGCGQPYYPAPTNVIPAIPAQPPTIITPGAPSIRSPIIGTPTVPAPPTRIPGATTVPGSSFPTDPANIRPSLTTPGTTVTPGTIITPGTTTTPGSSFGTPGSSFGTPAPGGSFGTPSGTNYTPAVDPYIQGSGSFSTNGASASRANRANVGTGRETRPTNTISEPTLAPGVRIIPGPEAAAPKANSRAPQLIDPRDKSASRPMSKWAVVPAVWPVKPSNLGKSPYAVAAGEPTARDYPPVSRFEPTQAAAATQDAAAYDDGGWQSAR